MTLLYSDPIFFQHETGSHPENAGRLRPTLVELDERGLVYRCRCVEPPPVARQRLARVHAASYIEDVRTLAKSGGGHLDPDTIVSPASYGVALAAAGAVCDAAERILRGEDVQAICLVRPPGHHALAQRGMGFCLFNNVAVAARAALDDLGAERALIVDWDVHHGNGTQAAFWEEPRVGFLSIHRWPFYPGTGSKDETGAGAGRGTTVNVPIHYGTPRAEYLSAFRSALDRLADRIKPQIVLISAGFDAHRLDPIGDLGLETEDFGALTNAVCDVAQTHAGGRVISVLEGGYNPDATAASIALHLETMLARCPKPVKTS